MDNPEKDKYITRIENEASEASAALKVAKDGTNQPHVRLVELTIARLEGIKPASQKQVEAFRGTLTSTKELKKAEDKASKVEDETNELWAMVDIVQLENLSLKEENEAIRKEKSFEDLRAKCFMLGSWFAIGGVLLLIGSSMLGASRKGGVGLLATSVFFFACPFIIQDVVESLWFRILVGSLIGMGVIAFLAEAYLHHTKVRAHLTRGVDRPT